MHMSPSVGLGVSSGTAFDPSSIDGLLAWYDAGDEDSFTELGGIGFTQWLDKSGNDNHLSKTGAPVYRYTDTKFNGNPYVQAGSFSVGLVAAGAVAELSGDDVPFTTFIVQETIGTGERVFFEFAEATTAQIKQHVDDSFDAHRVDYAGWGTRSLSFNIGHGPDIIGLRVTSSDIYEWINGAQTDDGFITAGNLTMSDLYLGIDAAGNNTGTVRIAHAIIYNRALDNEEMAQVFDYLNGIYEIYIDPPLNESLPAITGTAIVGNTLTVSNGTWTGGGTITYAYQWYRDDVAISGATSATYDLVAADEGTIIHAVVTATNAEASVDAQAADTATITQLPTNSVAPALSGTEEVGETLTVSNGTWAGTATITYARQWYRDDVAIDGATNSTYALVQADLGAVIHAVVTATNSVGSVSVASDDSGTIVQAPSNTALPTITGTAEVGETLSVSDGTWVGSPTITYAYAWYADDVVISGATSSTYMLASAQAGAVIHAVVTATSSVGSTGAQAADTAAVVWAPTNTVAPAISGSEVSGSTLTVTSGTWTGAPTPTYAYQWYRDDVAISGATASTYDLVVADEGAIIHAQVTATNSVGSVSAVSGDTGVIAAPSGGFVSTWNVGAGVTVVLPLAASGTYNFNVDWGDGSNDDITTYNQAETSHTYAAGGVYTVTITGQLEGWQADLSSGANRQLLQTISSFGADFRLSNGGGQFAGCSNLTSIADDLVTTGLTNLTGCFGTCGFTVLPDWDLSSVVTMANFASYNTVITTCPAYDLSSATDTSRMFNGCSALTTVGALNVSASTNLSLMFRNCTSLTSLPAGLGDTMTQNASMSDFLEGATINTTDYSRFLEELNAANANTGISFHGGNSTYNATNGATARAALVAKSWTITDGGAA